MLRVLHGWFNFACLLEPHYNICLCEIETDWLTYYRNFCLYEDSISQVIVLAFYRPYEKHHIIMKPFERSVMKSNTMQYT